MLCKEGKIFIVCDYLDILDITAAVSVIVLTSSRFFLDQTKSHELGRELNSRNKFHLSISIVNFACLHPMHQLVINWCVMLAETQLKYINLRIKLIHRIKNKYL